jgi:hypothetical protein
MNPRIVNVKALPDYLLHLYFKNGEERMFDVKPYLTTGVYVALQNVALFNGAKAEHGTVVWQQDLDFDPDRLYIESRKLEAVV